MCVGCALVGVVTNSGCKRSLGQLDKASTPLELLSGSAWSREPAWERLVRPEIISVFISVLSFFSPLHFLVL